MYVGRRNLFFFWGGEGHWARPTGFSPVLFELLHNESLSIFDQINVYLYLNLKISDLLRTSLDYKYLDLSF